MASKEWHREYNRKYPHKTWEYALKWRYGLTIEDYNKLFQDQNGCCAICGIHQTQLKKRLCVDHCHETEKIRGLLCLDCNRGLGLLGDTEQNLQKALEYLNG